MQEITPQIQKRLGIQDSEGVIITNVRPGTVAAEAGLRGGDVILEINRKKIKDLEDYRKTMDSIKNGETALLLVKREENTLYVALKTGVGNGKG